MLEVGGLLKKETPFFNFKSNRADVYFLEETHVD